VLTKFEIYRYFERSIHDVSSLLSNNNKIIIIIIIIIIAFINPA